MLLGAKKIYNILCATGFPVAYSSFKEKVQTPYVAYEFEDSSNLEADNKAFVKTGNYRIELYTQGKEPNYEEKLEKILDENEIFYEKDEVCIEEENLNQINYYINMMEE